ncbi:hypothetical protein Tco_0605303, partial [Tanacetum coccineum]
AIYRTGVCTEVCAGDIYPIKWYQEPGYDKQWQKTIEDSLYQKKLQDPLAKAKPTGAEGTTKGRKQNRNMSKSWKIGDIKDKEVNMEARDFDDVLVCCVENTIKVRIMDSGASFHATYCKEELERFKLRSGKRRLISVGHLDEEGYHVGYGEQQWKVTKGSLVVVRGNKRGSLIGTSMLDSKGNVPDVRKVDIYFCKPGGLGKQNNLSFIMSVKTRKLQSRSCGRYNANLQIVMLKIVPKTPLQFGVAKRLSRTFRAESMGIRVEAPKMLWADSVSMAYLIYRIPYVLIGLLISDEEWRGKDTSLTHLKVFSCDSFVKVKDVCGEAMKCTFIDSCSDEVRYSFRDTKSRQVIRSRDITFVDSIYRARSATNSSSLTKPIQKSQVVLVDIPENDSIVVEHGLSSEITQSLGGSSDISEGPKIVGASRIVEDQMKNTMKTEHPPMREAPRLHRYEDPPESPRLQVKEKQDGNKRYKAKLVVKGFQQIHGSWTKLVRILISEGSLSLLKDSWNEKPCRDVHQVGDEREVEVLRSFSWPSSELITEDGVLPERERVPYVRRYRKRVPYVRQYRKVRAVALLKGMWFEVYRDYLRRRAVK